MTDKIYKFYRQWNEAELIDRIRNAGSLSPKEAWEQYVDLWEFCLELSPQPSDLQSKLKFSEWQKYYSRIQRLEEWNIGRLEKCGDTQLPKYSKNDKKLNFNSKSIFLESKRISLL